MKFPESVLTIGKFEGIHRGHQRLINETVRYAKENGLASVAVTFNPHPYVLNDPSYKLLFTQAERALILKGMGVDYIEKYNFDAVFMAQTPEVFFKKLIHDFNVKAVIIGEGYRFGKNRAGTAETMQILAKKYNIDFFLMPCVHSGNHKISTSDIRRFLSAGSLTEAENFLGFPFFIGGTVAHGKKIGKKLGFPTVNIMPAADKFLPKDGVYATRVHRNGEIINGVTNIGFRPSFNDGEKRTVETFLLNFDGEMYGEEIRVDLKRFIRPERKFESLEDLKAQIERDVRAAL